MPPQDKLFKSYIEMELQLGNIDRCRTLYQKYIEWSPANAAAWGRWAGAHWGPAWATYEPTAAHSCALWPPAHCRPRACTAQTPFTVVARLASKLTALRQPPCV